MALPAVKTLLECSSFERTVAPYIPQLYDLPQQILQSYSNPQQLKLLYLTTNPLISALAFSLFISPIFLLVSEITRNYSQVDRCWPWLPTLYNIHFAVYAHLSGLPTDRLDNVLACSCVWGLRLTFNYWRKGGYKVGHEDYRWEVLRGYLSPPVFFIFNVAFISFAQSLLLFSITVPTYVLMLVSKIKPELSEADYYVPRIILGLVLVEWFADQQQWDFQNAKAKYLKTAKVPFRFDQEDLDRGFVVDGLWSYSRHPNFAAEQAIWVALYQWGCLTTSTLYNYSAVGAIGYLALFQASTWFTELITARKYPQYQEYQKRVGKFIPKWSSDLPGDFSDEKETEKVDGPQSAVVSKAKASKRK